MKNYKRILAILLVGASTLSGCGFMGKDKISLDDLKKNSLEEKQFKKTTEILEIKSKYDLKDLCLAGVSEDKLFFSKTIESESDSEDENICDKVDTYEYNMKTKQFTKTASIDDLVETGFFVCNGKLIVNGIRQLSKCNTINYVIREVGKDKCKPIDEGDSRYYIQHSTNGKDIIIDCYEEVNDKLVSKLKKIDTETKESETLVQEEAVFNKYKEDIVTGKEISCMGTFKDAVLYNEVEFNKEPRNVDAAGTISLIEYDLSTGNKTSLDVKLRSDPKDVAKMDNAIFTYTQLEGGYGILYIKENNEYVPYYIPNMEGECDIWNSVSMNNKMLFLETDNGYFVIDAASKSYEHVTDGSGDFVYGDKVYSQTNDNKIKIETYQ